MGAKMAPRAGTDDDVNEVVNAKRLNMLLWLVDNQQMRMVNYDTDRNDVEVVFGFRVKKKNACR